MVLTALYQQHIRELHSSSHALLGHIHALCASSYTKELSSFRLPFRELQRAVDARVPVL
jgi:hypothetical protein